MKTIQIIACVCWLGLYHSCTSSEILQDGSNLTKFASEGKMQSLTLKSELEDPYQIDIMDSMLIMANGGAMCVDIFNINNGARISQAIFKGNGPHELACKAMYIKSDPSDQTFSIYQRDFSRYTIYRINQLLEGEFEPIKQVQFETHIRDAVKTNSAYVCTGSFESASVSIQNDKGDPITNQDLYPPQLNTSLKNIDRYIVGQSRSSFHPKEQTLTLAYPFLGVLDFHQLIADSLVLRKRYVFDKHTDQIKKLKGSTIEYFKAAKTTQEHIYVLMSSTPLSKQPPSLPHLLVFDAAGTFKKAYRLDCQLTDFCVSPDDKQVYGLSFDKEGLPCIMHMEITI